MERLEHKMDALISSVGRLAASGVSKSAGLQITAHVLPQLVQGVLDNAVASKQQRQGEKNIRKHEAWTMLVRGCGDYDMCRDCTAVDFEDSSRNIDAS